ncbi:hypothetical protein K0I73_15745 [Shewanella mesophila]|uniref:hypothetical protein n=1 Tax=Shewanella mesophila TaxID=2864208 RepID=UPI001C65ADA6|nr:hypothetical protein [Shewanella mesophila]QYJ85623.1 hypothetical protein K0I73_15745 [Shewanella mesophila]
MKTLSRKLNLERVIAGLALMLLLIAAQVYTLNASDWFLLGLNILEATGVHGQTVDINQLPDVAKVGGDLPQWLLTRLRG